MMQRWACPQQEVRLGGGALALRTEGTHLLTYAGAGQLERYAQSG